MQEAGLEGMGKIFQGDTGVEKVFQKASGGRKNTEQSRKGESVPSIAEVFSQEQFNCYNL